MVYLPNEIINLILSFREINPTAKLIRQSIEDYELLQSKKNILYKFESYYLSTLMEYQQNENHKDWRKKYKLFEPQSKIVDNKRRLQIIDGIDRVDDNDRKLYLEHSKITEINGIFTSFVFDLQHSIECTGMINDEYFYRLYDRKNMSESNDRRVESYKEWCYYYEKWYNKYRNEIYNGNKVMKKRPTDIYFTPSDYTYTYICMRVENDINNYVDWRL
jgi:hypothetical protein